MTTKEDIKKFLESHNLMKAEVEYLNYHSQRFAFVVNLINKMVFQNDGTLEVLDIGPHFLIIAIKNFVNTDLRVSTLGWKNERLVPDYMIHKHYNFDLNKTQDERDWIDIGDFDLIVLAEVIEHVYTSPNHVLRFLCTALKKNGILIIQTPKAVSLSKRVLMLRGKNPYELIRDNNQGPGHFREYTMKELVTFCENCKLTPVLKIYSDYWCSENWLRILEKLIDRFKQGLTIVCKKEF